MVPALRTSDASAESALLLAPAAAALLGLAQPAPWSGFIASVAAPERERLLAALERATSHSDPIALALSLRLHDGRTASAAIELHRIAGGLALQLLDVDPACGAPALPTASKRLALREGREPDAALCWEWDLAADSPLLCAALGTALGYPQPAGRTALAAWLHPEDSAQLTQARQQHLDALAPFAPELRVRGANGTYRWFRFDGAVRRDERGAALYLSGSALDIEPLKQTQARVAQQEQEIERLGRESRELAIRIIDAQETERRHIARELHDQTGQTLTAAVLDLEFWKDKGVPADEIAGVLANVKLALSEIRNISLQLRPPMLDEAGLEAALRVYLERQAASGKFDVSFAVEGTGRLAPELELTAFRLVQEAVTNILRHAGARHVDVSLRIGTQELTLRVSDNGSGCVAQDALGSATGGMSLGLISMRERAALVGGHCEFISAPAAGSMVLARLPLRR